MPSSEAEDRPQIGDHLIHSGTDALVGIAGTMAITIENKQHHYTFEYTVPAV